MIDSHCHLDQTPILENLKEIILRSKKEGIEKILTICTTLKSYQNILSIVETDDIIYGTFGIHPHETNNDRIDKWKIYNTSNSLLPSNKIRKIKKDSKNNLWLATSEGLVKYHKEFKVVLSQEKNGIINDDFVSLDIDKNDKIWAGTNNGLYSYKDK